MFKKIHNSTEILCIGEELLSGNTLNSNATWLAKEFSKIGLRHLRQTVIGDDSKNIQKFIKEASKRCNLIVTTGGLGPTPDDLTKESIAKAFCSPLIEFKAISLHIKNQFKSSNSNIPISNFKQAFFPKDSLIIPNPTGTAPGMIWTPITDFTIITLPGVPFEMKNMWNNTVIQWIKDNITVDEIVSTKTLSFTGISESLLADKIRDLLEIKNPIIAPYASLGEVKLRITAKGPDLESANNLIKPILSELIKRTGDKCFSKNEKTLAETIITLLEERKETLAVAESCTGGKLGDNLTSIPGVSNVFKGGIIAYSNFAKQEILGINKELINHHGAVSEEVAKAMAIATKEKLDADWAIAISGIAGPSGGTEQKPIGFVQFGIAGPNLLNSISVNFGSHRDRIEIQELSVMRALNELRLILLKKA